LGTKGTSITRICLIIVLAKVNDVEQLLLMTLIRHAWSKIQLQYPHEKVELTNKLARLLLLIALPRGKQSDVLMGTCTMVHVMY
jgi:hypothetical protein